MTRRLLIVEDDLALRTGLVDAFRGEGYEVLDAADGASAGELLFSRHIDLVILDVMLPLKGGLEILREMRREGLETPVLLLTARGDVNDRVLGLELGADDYLTKPFNLRELSARVKALLRRDAKSRPVKSAEAASECFRVGEAEVDLAAFEIRRGEATHPLSPKEAAMLSLLHRRQGEAVRRTDFLRAVWGDTVVVTNRTIDTHVLNLRQKLETDPRNPAHLLTVHGVGYRLVP
jgi:DNA-binding response OmpR family regulator